MEIKEAEDILVYHNNSPKSIYTGKVFKDNVISYIIDSKFHISSGDIFYKFKQQIYNFEIISYKNISGELVFKITPDSKDRYTDLVLELYDSTNTLKYILNILTIDTSKYWEYYPDPDSSTSLNWSAKIRDLNNSIPNNFTDQFWKYTCTEIINIV